VRRGGVLILLAQCAEGWAADEGSRPLLVNSHPKAIIAELNERYARRRAESAGADSAKVAPGATSAGASPPTDAETESEGPQAPKRSQTPSDAEADSPASYTAALVFSFILEFRSLEVIVVSDLEGLEETFLLTAPSLAEALEIAEERVGALSSVGVIRGGRRLLIP
jgi:hypothetical protein